MKQRMIMALTALFTVMGSTFLPRLEAAALTRSSATTSPALS